MELDEEALLDELIMSLRQDVAAAEPWQPCPGGEGMMMSGLVLYGAEAADGSMEAPAPPLQHGLTVAAPMAPPVARPHGELFNFDCLSEVCNPYGSCAGAGAAVLPVTVDPFHPEAAVVDDGTSGDHQVRRHGGWSSSSPAFMFGSGAGGEGPEMTGICAAQPSGKLPGAPSKNLMAERRRRKRLNDRLSMLRSVVPMISKMDRTSILGDTIDYVKDLTERIKILEKEIGASPEELNLLHALKDLSGDHSEMPVRNSTKFDAERAGGGGDDGSAATRIEMRCPTNPGALLSTLGALDALGLEVEQCVVSCFGDVFGMVASCSQDEEKMQAISTDEIKQGLLRSAGYGGGRCL